ncbi:hypothetical protein LP414_27355 [Polaromonas sp. P1(28)-13]|nr:hypothetical protein LP414_27355 [Polaromonas sp. P1(28)-13]
MSVEFALKDLVDTEYDLTAVATDQVWPEDPDASTISFTLDGVTYMAIEDVEDGYRSALGMIKRVELVLPNQFPACRVAEFPGVSADWEESKDLLQFRSLQSGKVIMEVGTDHTDDYYPSFIASFRPENMDANDPKTYTSYEVKPEAFAPGWATW